MSVAGPAHLSIGEVLSLLQSEFPDVTISKIRFLESQGLLDPERTPSGYRKFYDTDIDRLRWILRQQRENFLPLKVIKERLADAGGDPARAVVDPEPSAAGASADGGDARHGGAPAGEATAGEVRAGEDAGPAWMADAARAAASRAEAAARDGGEGGDGRVTDTSAPQSARPVSPLDQGPTRVSMTLEELAAACSLTANDLRELERFGLLVPRTVGPDQLYDGDALVIAQKAAGFLARGLEARHLRMFKVAAEREAGFLEQVVMPMLKQRNPAARQQAVETMAELALLAQGMRAALLRQALRPYTGGT